METLRCITWLDARSGALARIPLPRFVRPRSRGPGSPRIGLSETVAEFRHRSSVGTSRWVRSRGSCRWQNSGSLPKTPREMGDLLPLHQIAILRSGSPCPCPMACVGYGRPPPHAERRSKGRTVHVPRNCRNTVLARGLGRLASRQCRPCSDFTSGSAARLTLELALCPQVAPRESDPSGMVGYDKSVSLRRARDYRRAPAVFDVIRRWTPPARVRTLRAPGPGSRASRAPSPIAKPVPKSSASALLSQSMEGGLIFGHLNGTKGDRTGLL